MKRYFSYSADGGFELHDSLDEAKTAAEKEFEICRDEAYSDGWPECTDEICYGEVNGAVVETERAPWDESKFGPPPNGEHDVEYVKYELRPNA